MKAMVLRELCSLAANSSPLLHMDMPDPVPAPGEILVRVSACGVCHTDLDEIEGRTPPPHLPVIPGHQVVGRVEAINGGGGTFRIGDRVGIAWVFSTCGACRFCLDGRENLCPAFRATGRDVSGGYARYMTARESFAYRLPGELTDAEAAPLLCAGAIGYRALQLTGLRDGQSLGLTGFGASGHLVLKLVRRLHPGTRVFVFARSATEREFSRELGACWAGDIGERSPERLSCIIDTTPAWKPVIESLQDLEPGGRLVINAIRKEDSDRDQLLRLDYAAHLWMEKEVRSVANISRRDVTEFLALAAAAGIKPEFREFALHEANQALAELKAGRVRGAKVLRLD